LNQHLVHRESFGAQPLIPRFRQQRGDGECHDASGGHACGARVGDQRAESSDHGRRFHGRICALWCETERQDWAAAGPEAAAAVC
jgi:hypothetical protein